MVNLASKEIEIIPLYYKYVLGSDYPVVILVGGRNSGKSYFMEQLAAINLNNCDKYKLLVTEDVEVNIGGGVKAGIEERIEQFGHEVYYRSTKVPAEITNKVNGNNVLFKGYHSDKQQKQVKSLNEITAVWFEEAESITYNQFKALRMQLRGGQPEDRKLYLTLNPVNENSFINHYYFQQPPDEVFEHFSDGRPKVFVKNIDVDLDEGGEITRITIPCLVVVSTHWDNPYLTAEQRADIEELKHTDPDMYAMLSEGKFVKPAGTYFKEFNYGIHTCDPFVIPDHWKRYRAIDYGLDMLACLWMAVSPDGRVYVYKEVNKPDLIISEAAKEIIRVNGGDDIRYTYAPGDLWSRTKDSGITIQETFSKHGVRLTQVSNKRVQGWLTVKEHLAVYDTRDPITGAPIKMANLTIFNTCTTLIKHIAMIQRDDKDPNDCATQPHDITHICDSLRYVLVTRTKDATLTEDKRLPRKKVDRYVNIMTDWG